MTKTRMKIKPDVALDTNGASFKIVLWKTTAVVFKVARNRYIHNSEMIAGKLGGL